MKTNLLRAGALGCALLTTTALTTPALAQGDMPPVISPINVEVDQNGVNVTTGRMAIDGPGLAVAAAPNLRFDRAQNAAPYVVGRLSGGTGSPVIGNYSVHIGGRASESFRCVNALCDSVTGTGSVYLIDSDPNPPDLREFRQAGTGARYLFDVRHQNVQGFLQYYASRVIWPNGETITYTYESGGLTGGMPGIIYRRPRRIASSMGYHIDLAYPVQYMDEDINGWSTPSSATLYRTTEPDVPLRRLTFVNGTARDSGSTVADTTDDRTYSCCSTMVGGEVELSSGSLQLPGEATPTLQVTPGPGQNGALIQTVTRDGVPWTYSYANPHRPPGSLTWRYDSVTVTGPNGYHRIYHMTEGGFSWNTRFNVLSGVTVVAGGGAPDRVTSYEIDSVSSRPLRVTYPEGNEVSVQYDDAGNVTLRRMHAKPNSGTSPAEITEQAHYPLPGLPQFCDTSCWRPDWTRDALQRQTDYRYNANGQLIERSEPADANGVRRRTVIEYSTSPSGISRRRRVRVCAVTSPPGSGLDTCNSHQSTMTDYEYLGDTLLVTLERQWDTVTGASLDTQHSYDVEGRLLSTDGPLPGTDDAVYYRYDLFGRRTWEIGPRATNGVRTARRFTYRNSDDRPTLVESGWVPNEASTTLTPLNQTAYGYDPRRNLDRETLSAGGTAYSVVQRTFDHRNQLLCEARRMNPAVYASLPSSACDLGQQGQGAGDFGPDRITRIFHDNLGQRVQVREGVDTSAEAAAATWDYNLNGLVTTIVDGNGNRAALRYDGHMRQSCWMLPSTTRPAAFNDTDQATALATAGALSGTFDAFGRCASGDYEAYGYDAAGNRTSHRKRDGLTLSFQHDHLNRLVRKTVPERPGLAATQTRDVFYGYDLRNQPLFARFDGAATGSEGVTNQYDGLGRPLSSALLMDGVSRPLWSAHDEGGRRIRITHPDNIHFTYEWDAAGRLDWVRANGTAQVAHQNYYVHGGMAGRSYGSGVFQQWLYDPVQRLSGIALNLGGTAQDVAWSFVYNPAGQIRTATRDNDAYAFTGHANGSRAYTANGLNQYSNVAGAALTHDANGNLTSDGARSYSYDVENRLVGATGGSGAVSLRYDPLGRLYEVAGPTEARRFLWDGDALAGEYDMSGAMTARYVHGGMPGADDPVVAYAGATLTQPAWLHPDHQGSIVALSNSAGVATLNAYDEYGVPRAGNVGRFGYTGQLWLPDLGLYHYKARVYDPGLGRFLQTDPVGYEDQFNLYAYVGNDPVNATDPTGNASDPTCGSRLGISASCSGGSTLGIIGDWRKVGPTGPRTFVAPNFDTEGAGAGGQTSGSTPCETNLECWRLRIDSDYVNGRISRSQRDDRQRQVTLGGIVGGILGGALILAPEVAAAVGARWTFGAFKSSLRWANQMQARGWTPRQITEAIRRGRQYTAPNNINPANGATRYVHPSTGQSIVRDNVTGEIIHIGGPGFRY